MQEANPPARPPGRPRAGMNDTVFAATLGTIQRVGYAAATVERIAATAGVAKTTIYRRWPTKADLVVAAISHRKAAMGLQLPDTGTLRGDLIEMLVRGAQYMSETQGKSIFRMMMCEKQNPELQQVSERMKREGEQSPRQLLQRAIARGELPPEVDMELMMHTLFGPLIHRVFMHNDVFTRDEAERLVDIVLYGVVPRPARG